MIYFYQLSSIDSYRLFTIVYRYIYLYIYNKCSNVVNSVYRGMGIKTNPGVIATLSDLAKRDYLPIWVRQWKTLKQIISDLGFGQPVVFAWLFFIYLAI